MTIENPSTRSSRSLVTLANVNELATRVISSVVGNDIADTINNASLTSGVICTIVQNRLKSQLEKPAARR